VPNKYLRQHVTNFLNDTSYINTKKNVAAVAVLQAQVEQSAKSAIKVEAAHETKQHRVGLPPQTSRVAQLDTDRTSSLDAQSPPPPPPPPHTQSHLYQSHQGQVNHMGSGQSVSIVDSSRMSGYQQQQPAIRQTLVQSTGHGEMGHGNTLQPPASNIGYQQSIQMPGVNVGQSLSAPSLLSHAQQTE